MSILFYYTYYLGIRAVVHARTPLILRVCAERLRADACQKPAALQTLFAQSHWSDYS